MTDPQYPDRDRPTSRPTVKSDTETNSYKYGTESK